MNRRDFLATSAASVALSALNAHVAGAAEIKPMRVGLIGTGWYGKCDLMRLIQVAPVEVVSLCDVDSKMVADAAELVASRQASKKKPRTFSDYRQMLAEKDLDLVLIGTPDHWHALNMIAAVESGADVYCQKPISVDIAEGQAMLAAARKTSAWCRLARSAAARRTSSRRRSRLLKKADWAKSRWWKFTATTTCEPIPIRLTSSRRQISITICGPAPLPCGHTASSLHPRSWRAFMEYGNGIVGDMCVHMLDMTRWMMGLGWPTASVHPAEFLSTKPAKPTFPTRKPPRLISLKFP